MLSRSGLRLEHPLITELHHQIVCCRIYSPASLTSKPFRLVPPPLPATSVWTRFHDGGDDGDAPTKGGGHAMCIEYEKDVIYLFDGWDGKKSLDDFWAYDIRSER